MEPSFGGPTLPGPPPASVVITAALWFSGGLNAAAVASVLAPLAASLRFGPWGAGLVVGAAPLGAALGGLCGSVLFNGPCITRGLRVAAAVLMVGSFSASLGPGLVAVAAGRALGGLGTGIVWAGAVRCVQDEVPSAWASRARALQAGIQVAGAAGILCGFCCAPLLQAAFPALAPDLKWRIVLCLPAAHAAPAFFWAFFCEDETDEKWSARQESTAGHWAQHEAARVFAAWTDPHARRPLAAALSLAILQATSGFDVLLCYANVVLSRSRADPSTRAWTLAATGLALVAGQVLSAVVGSSWCSRRWLHLATGACSTVCLLLLGRAVAAGATVQAALCFWLLMAAAQVGLFGALPGDQFPASLRTQGASFEVFAGRLSAGLLVFILPFMDHTFGLQVFLAALTAVGFAGLTWAHGALKDFDGKAPSTEEFCIFTQGQRKDPYPSGRTVPVPYARRGAALDVGTPADLRSGRWSARRQGQAAVWGAQPQSQASAVPAALWTSP